MDKLVNGKFFFYIYLTLNFKQVIFERRNTGVVFYSILYQKKKNSQMIKLNNHTSEMVLLVFRKKDLDLCSFPARQKNKQMLPTTSFQNKLFKFTTMCFRCKTDLLLLLFIRCLVLQSKSIGLRNFKDFSNNCTFSEEQPVDNFCCFRLKGFHVKNSLLEGWQLY